MAREWITPAGSGQVLEAGVEAFTLPALGAQLQENQASAALLEINKSDAIAVTEAATLALDPFTIVAFDSIALAESTAAELTADLLISAFDAVAVGEAVNFQILENLLVIDVSDDVAIGEFQLFVYDPLRLFAADAIAANEAVSLSGIEGFFLIDVSDVIAAAESVALGELTELFHIDVFDAILLEESEALAVDLFLIAVFDSSGVTEFFQLTLSSPAAGQSPLPSAARYRYRVTNVIQTT